MSLEGHGVLIVAKDTITDEMPLCLGIGETGNQAKLVPCFHDWVPPVLDGGWERGAVIAEETAAHNRWGLGPCTTDGNLQRLESGEMYRSLTVGGYTVTGPRCMLKVFDGPRAGRCFDTDSNPGLQPGNETLIFPCTDRWFQFLSFGDDRLAPVNSLYATIPTHVIRQIRNHGHPQHYQHMCLGVYGRGDHDEEVWEEDDHERDPYQRSTSSVEETRNEVLPPLNDQRMPWKPLTEFSGEQIITTQCTNRGAVIEWIYVPFIVEDDKEGEEL